MTFPIQLIVQVLSPAFLIVSASLASLAYASGPTQLVTGVALQVDRLSRVVQTPEFDAFAEVMSLNAARLAVESAGVVRDWYADVGSRVQKGDRLLSLDDRDAQLDLAQARAQVEAAQARLALADAQYKRAEGLVAQGFFSQEALLQRATERALAQSDFAAANARANLAQRAIEKTVLHAPFAGVVLERLAQKGETLNAGSVAFVLSDPVSVEVEARLSAEQVQSLRAAGSIVFRWASGESQLRILRISDVAVMPSRAQTVRLGLLPAGQRPLSGVTGKLVWKGGQTEIPRALMVRRGSALGIFVLSKTAQSYIARFVPLPFAQEGRPARLEKVTGLEDGALVVVRGQDSLQDGQQVDAGLVRVQP